MSYSIEEVTGWLEAMAAGAFNLKDDNIGLARDALSLLSDVDEQELPEGNLSQHFTLSELTYSDTAKAMEIDNTPNADETQQLADLANKTLEGIRLICGSYPVLISSGYRCPELNTAIGGADNSAHKYGCAADFTVPSFGTPLDVCRALEPHLARLEIDQLIHENDAWVHVGRAIPPSTEPRCQCLTIDGGTTVTGIV